MSLFATSPVRVCEHCQLLSQHSILHQLSPLSLTFQIPGKPLPCKALLIGIRHLLAQLVHNECYVCPILFFFLGKIKEESVQSTPASRQMRPAALSTAYPLRPRTPACAQADRWWPEESSGWPHPQQRAVRRRGNPRRREHGRAVE